MSAANSRSKIITFYSYKGGTGRSMAVANIAWILASSGKRVLVIDWDLEAPGLHRYFHPFLEDKELSSSPGIIDFVSDLDIAARHEYRTPPDTRNEHWYQDHISLLRYARPIIWDFPDDGCIDLVPAGQQDLSYAQRVTSFDWHGFYENLGGGVIFESLKRWLRDEYDYVLVDSRTGVSDTSGICTVQLPDDLVVMFTLNRQSILGAAAVATSAFEQRRKPDGEPGLIVWPIPTRVELNEKERLDNARQLARTTFQKFLQRVERKQRAGYWGGVEVFYQPYFAYEEVLATFAERKHQTASILMSMEAITRHLTNGAVSEYPSLSEQQRLDGLAKFIQKAPRGLESAGRIYVCYRRGDRRFVTPLLENLEERFGEEDVEYVDRGERRRGMAKKVPDAKLVLALIGPAWKRTDNWDEGDSFRQELQGVLQRNQLFLPVLVGGVDYGIFSSLPEFLRGGLASRSALLVSNDPSGSDVELLLTTVERLLASVQGGQPPDPEDPQKGQWGGLTQRNGRTLTATVRQLSRDWFEIELEVVGTPLRPLSGTVDMHLHPTCVPPVQTVEARDGRARLLIRAWGAFTVGVSADAGATLLELDLAQVPDAPALFRER
jgi:cellulose biosynthesis protein BcsQ